MTGTQGTDQRDSVSPSAGIRGARLGFETPVIDDASAMWHLVRDSGVLDLNSPYSYLLWCRDFAATSVVARDGDRLAGLVTGYRRPEADDTLVVWQVAVDAAYRRQGLARAMIEHLLDRVGTRYLEATITLDNTASVELFSRIARGRGAGVVREVLFDASLFPGGDHESEVMFRIGPLRP